MSVQPKPTTGGQIQQKQQTSQSMELHLHDAMTEGQDHIGGQQTKSCLGFRLRTKPKR